MIVKFVTTEGTFQEVLFFILLEDVICFVYYRFRKNFPICHHVVTVQYRKWSPTANDPETANAPQNDAPVSSCSGSMADYVVGTIQ